MNFFAPWGRDIISALMVGMEHSGCDKFVKLFYCLIVVFLTYCLCLLQNAMIFQICREFFDVFADETWVVTSDASFRWVDYGRQSAVEQTCY